MALFLISYDLHKDRNYQPLYDAMEKLESKAILESVWMLEVNNTATEVRDWLHDLLDDDDKIFVIELRPQHAWASRNLGTSVNNWIREHNSV